MTDRPSSTPQASPDDSPPASRRGPLDGLIVADLSRVLAGPYCSMLLADLGATVIKVESADGDDTRTWMPPEKDGVSTYFMSINRNKRSIVLDFRDPDDVALVHELFRRSDIVLENFKPGALVKFGLDYESARAVNESLIYLSISGFGTAEGSWLPGYDLVVQAVSGLMSLTGAAGRPRLPRRHLGVRRDDRAARHDRRAGGAQSTERDRRGPARRGEPAVVGDVGARQPDGGVRGRRRGAAPDGERTPQRLPVPDDAHQGPRHHHHRGQRPSVPVVVRGVGRSRTGRRRTLPAQRRSHGEPGRAPSPPASSASPHGVPTICSSRSTRSGCPVVR